MVLYEQDVLLDPADTTPTVNLQASEQAVASPAILDSICHTAVHINRVKIAYSMCAFSCLSQPILPSLQS